MWVQSWCEVMQTVSGSHTDELAETTATPKKSSRVEHENTVGPLTSASTLGCVLASDALIQALKYANFCLCWRIWVNFPPFVRVMEACRIEHTGLNYRVVKHHNHHR